MSEIVERIEDRLADFTRDKRVIILSGMAWMIGALGAVMAYLLVWLIAVFTNLAFYGQFSSVFQSPDRHRLGYFVVVIPVLGGVIIGFMARYGSEKIRGHGIPEALEAILFGRSRMEPKVAVLKPLSSALSIGTGGPFGAEGPIIMTGGAVGSIFAQFFSSLLRRAKDPARGRRRGGHVGDLRLSGGGVPLGGRAAALRMAAALVHPRGGRRRLRLGASRSAHGSRADLSRSSAPKPRRRGSAVRPDRRSHRRPWLRDFDDDGLRLRRPV
jgi:hypothetical protein